MAKLTLTIFTILILSGVMYSQSSAIKIDGNFDDWSGSIATYTDPSESISGIDLLSFQVTNDDEFLFIHLILDTEIVLCDDLINHGVRLYLDTDNNPATGFTGAQSGFGAELGVVFKDRFAFYNVTPSSTIDLDHIDFRREVTTSGTEFEMAIRRDAVPDGINPLFPSSVIKVLFVETFDDDEMPNFGETFSYTFDETSVIEDEPISLEKVNSNYIRCLAYNTLNQLDDPNLQDEYMRILQAINPDVIGFSEVSGTSASEVKTQLDSWLPLGTSFGWYTEEDDFNLITASKWPIYSTWDALDRHFAVLIDLPASFESDLLFINAHLKCCSDITSNNQRQMQVDEFASFILDAKNPGGIINIPDDTPFIFAGDMNFVGYSQQYETVITGDIQNTGAFGSGASLDWDNTDLADAFSLQTDKRMAYTYRNDGQSYPPGRIDYIFYSDAVLEMPKTFVLRTEVMSTERLSSSGLLSSDTQLASDHLPVVSDFSIVNSMDSDGDGIVDNSDNCPNSYNPSQEDWNSNGLGDVCEDSDGDNLSDSDELQIYLTDPANSDSDGDNLNDGIEINLFGTDPNLVDTDDDGLSDFLEVGYSITSPLMFDSDGDGCDDASFFHFQCAGQNVESDCPEDINNDGLVDVNDFLQLLTKFDSNCD